MDTPHDDLRALSACYASRADDGAYVEMAGLFGPSGQLVTPRGTRTGETEIAEALAGLGRYDRTFHLLGQVRVWQDANGDWRGETYCTAHHFTSSDTTPGATTDMVMHIRYHDRFAPDPANPDGWIFAERRLDLVASGSTELVP